MALVMHEIPPANELLELLMLLSVFIWQWKQRRVSRAYSTVSQVGAEIIGGPGKMNGGESFLKFDSQFPLKRHFL